MWQRAVHTTSKLGAGQVLARESGTDVKTALPCK